MILCVDLIGPNGTRCRELEFSSEEALKFLSEYKEQLENMYHPLSTKVTEKITLKVKFEDDSHVNSAISLLDSKIDTAE